MSIKKDMNYYLNLNWSFCIEQASHKSKHYYIIRVNELPGVCTDATSIEEGMKNIQEALEGTIRLYLKHGDPIPEPIQKDKYRGNIAYRTSSERHYHLAKLAKERHKSLSKTLDDVVDAGIKQIRPYL